MGSKVSEYDNTWMVCSLSICGAPYFCQAFLLAFQETFRHCCCRMPKCECGNRFCI